MSKFVFGSFIGGYDEFAVNAEKYTYEQAIDIFKQEYACENDRVGAEVGEYIVSNAFVKWRAGMNEDNEPVVGWWLEYQQRPKGSCPVWAFHKRQKHDRVWGNEVII